MSDLIALLRDIEVIIEPVFGTLDPVLMGRLLLVVVLCGMIGLERSEHERASGFRPHILVGLGASLMTMAGAYSMFDTEMRDPMRVASYVVSGIGFLGAGAILRHGTTVRGLTTAASIWGSAGIGITVGVGLGWLATMATLLILFTLTTLEWVEVRLGRGEAMNDLKLHLKDDNRSVGKALAALDRLSVPVKRATVLPESGDSAVLRVELTRPIRAENVPRLVRQLLTVKSIVRVDVAALEVEDADDLVQSIKEMRKATEQQVKQMNLDDDNLLEDLNEPEYSVSKSLNDSDNNRPNRRILYPKKRQSKSSEDSKEKSN